jgi:hypothetical protein
MEEKNTGGRPRVFESPEEMVDFIDSYFKTKHEKLENPTVSGLALYLGFESRQSFYDYEKDPVFSYTIKKARLRMEEWYESNLLTRNATGAIFALKNFGWTDKQEIDHTTNGQEMKTFNLIVKPDKE